MIFTADKNRFLEGAVNDQKDNQNSNRYCEYAGKFKADSRELCTMFLFFAVIANFH
jgi:hypothetical protein